MPSFMTRRINWSLYPMAMQRLRSSNSSQTTNTRSYRPCPPHNVPRRWHLIRRPERYTSAPPNLKKGRVRSFREHLPSGCINPHSFMSFKVKKSVPLGPISFMYLDRMLHAIGIYLGATKIKYGIVDGGGNILHEGLKAT